MADGFDKPIMPKKEGKQKSPEAIPVDDKGQPLPDPSESLSGYIVTTGVENLKNTFASVEVDEGVRETMEPPQQMGFIKRHLAANRGYSYYGTPASSIPKDANGVEPSPLSRLFSEAEVLNEEDANNPPEVVAAPIKQGKIATPKQSLQKNDDIATARSVFEKAGYHVLDDISDSFNLPDARKDSNTPRLRDMYQTNTKVIYQSEADTLANGNKTEEVSAESTGLFTEPTKLSRAKRKIEEKQKKKEIKAQIRLEKQKAKARKKAEKEIRKAQLKAEKLIAKEMTEKEKAKLAKLEKIITDLSGKGATPKSQKDLISAQEAKIQQKQAQAAVEEAQAQKKKAEQEAKLAAEKAQAEKAKAEQEAKLAAEKAQAEKAKAEQEAKLAAEKAQKEKEEAELAVLQAQQAKADAETVAKEAFKKAKEQSEEAARLIELAKKQKEDAQHAAERAAKEAQQKLQEEKERIRREQEENKQQQELARRELENQQAVARQARIDTEQLMAELEAMRKAAAAAIAQKEEAEKAALLAREEKARLDAEVQARAEAERLHQEELAAKRAARKAREEAHKEETEKIRIERDRAIAKARAEKDAAIAKAKAEKEAAIAKAKADKEAAIAKIQRSDKKDKAPADIPISKPIPSDLKIDKKTIVSNSLKKDD